MKRSRLLSRSRGVYKVDGCIHEQTSTCAIAQYYAHCVQMKCKPYLANTDVCTTGSGCQLNDAAVHVYGAAVYVCICICIFSCICACVYKYVYIVVIDLCMYVFEQCAYIYIYIYMRMQMYMYIYMYYTYIHIYTRHVLYFLWVHVFIRS
jgi:hypothetical protein